MLAVEISSPAGWCRALRDSSARAILGLPSTNISPIFLLVRLFYLHFFPQFVKHFFVSRDRRGFRLPRVTPFDERQSGT